MAASDGIIVGQNVISESLFNDPHFEEDFTSLPDTPLASDPNGTGKWDDEHWLIGKKLEGGWADGPDNSGIVLNKETQRYVSARGPTPDGWSPFESTSDGLLVKAREVPNTVAYKDWAIGKRYGEGGIRTGAPYGGLDLFVSDFANRNDIPGSEGYDWFAEGDGRIRWDRYPLKWSAGILSTGNERAGLDQGRFEVVGMCPRGAIYNANGDVRDQSCTFAAWWLIEQFKVGRGRNRQPLPGGYTHYPFTGGSLLNELDPMEHGGFDPYSNHNSRHLYYGSSLALSSDGDTILLDGVKTSFLPIIDMTQVMVRVICDITYEKIGMAIGLASGDCKYTRAINTPGLWKKTRREYSLSSPSSGTVNYDSSGVPIELGELTDDNGDPTTRQFMALLNIAMDGKWLRERLIWERQSILNRGYSYPSYATENGLKTASMLLRYCSMRALREAKFERAGGGFWEPHKNGTNTGSYGSSGGGGGTGSTGGGSPVVSSEAYRPVHGRGINYSQGLIAGQHQYELQNPDLADTGTFDWSDYGSDATLISGERGPTLKLQVAPTSLDTVRTVRYVLDD